MSKGGFDNISSARAERAARRGCKAAGLMGREQARAGRWKCPPGRRTDGAGGGRGTLLPAPNLLLCRPLRARLPRLRLSRHLSRAEAPSELLIQFLEVLAEGLQSGEKTQHERGGGRERPKRPVKNRLRHCAAEHHRHGPLRRDRRDGRSDWAQDGDCTGSYKREQGVE